MPTFPCRCLLFAGLFARAHNPSNLISSDQPTFFIHPKHDVHVLYSLTAGSFTQIINGPNKNSTFVPRISPDSDLKQIGAIHGPNIRECSFRKNLNERFVPVK